ncbi:MAG: ACT domain-containing protein [Actinomycetota bacterium]
MERLVLTAIGEDRRGLVEEVSEFVLDRGGSIEESRMANLMGQFAIAMLVAGGAEAIGRDLDAFAASAGIDARIAPARGSAAPRGPALRFEAKALDQPGLVHEIADVFREHGANVESFESTIEPAPVSGSPVFAMEVVVTFDGDEDALRADLERAGASLGIDWTLTSLQPA